MQVGVSEWALLQLQLPSRPLRRIGVLLIDDQDELHIKVTDRWWQDLEREGGEIWATLVDDFADQARRMGAKQFLELLTAVSSHAVQVTDCERIATTDIKTQLEELYKKHVQQAQERVQIARRSFPTWLAKIWPQPGFPAHAGHLAAACFLIVAMSSNLSTIPQTRLPTLQEPDESPSPELPASLPWRTQPLLLDPTALARSIYSERNTRHRKFRTMKPILGHVSVRVPRVAHRYLDPPHIDVAANLDHSLLLLDQTTLPPPRPKRRNPFARVLKVFTLPLKVIGRAKS